MPQAFCYHRWTIVKRWTVKDAFHAIQKCRKCQRWKRTDLTMEAERGKLDISHAFERSGLENSSAQSENTTHDNQVNENDATDSKQ